MNTDKNNKNLDEQITNAIGRDGLKFDFNKWKNEHEKEVQIYKSQTTEQTIQSARIYRIGKIIMKSPIRKLAAAAVLIIAIMLLFNNGSVTTPAFGFDDITAALQKAKWAHTIMTIVELNWDEDEKKSIGDKTETWQSVNPSVSINIDSDGKITYLEKETGKLSTYNPESNTITIRYVQLSDLDGTYASLSEMFESQINDMKKKAEEFKYEEGILNGKHVTIIKTEFTSDNDFHSIFSIMVDPESYLPQKMIIEQILTSKNQSGKAEVIFDYPDSGPKDIYEAGVPRDAKIVVVDQTKTIDVIPSEEYMAIWNNYKRIRDEATQDYIALITHSEISIGKIITMVDLDYKYDINHRWERHFVFKIGQRFTRDQQNIEQLGNTFQSIFKWAQEHYNDTGSISVSFYNDSFYYSTTREEENWSEIRKVYSEFSLLPNDTLVDLGWPYIGRAGHIIEDDFSKQNNLICIERLQQGSINYDNDTVSLPGRFLCYLDEQKDYLCIRKVTEWSPDADWQEDKNWLEKIEPEKIKDGSITIEDITETFQAPNGHWYPKVIEERQTGIRKDYKEASLKHLRTKTLYIKTNPEFPEGIFDPNNLAKETN